MVEILLSVMNVEKEDEYKQILLNNRISGNVVAVNQVDKNKKKLKIENSKQKIYSYNEKGASRSRNRLIELATGDVCAFADNDMKYEENYQEIIEQAYKDKPDAECIVFYIENSNKEREKIKKIGNRKINKINCMRVRTSEITLKKSAIEKLKELNIKFNENFGPCGKFNKGEETVFISNLLDAGIKIYSVNKKIGQVGEKESTWFTGFDKEYLYSEGAIIYKISKRFYWIFILQYLFRKYFQYRKQVGIVQAYKEMKKGAKDAKAI